MENLRTYIDTKHEQKIVILRKKLLLAKKEELYQKYVGIKGIAFDKEQSISHDTQDSKVIAYLTAIEQDKQNNGKTIQEELKELEAEEKRLEKCITDMENHLEQMQGFEYQLFYTIAILGKGPKKAVEMLAAKNFISERQAWRKYETVKSYIRELRK